MNNVKYSTLNETGLDRRKSSPHRAFQIKMSAPNSYLDYCYITKSFKTTLSLFDEAYEIEILFTQNVPDAYWTTVPHSHS